MRCAPSPRLRKALRLVRLATYGLWQPEQHARRDRRLVHERPHRDRFAGLLCAGRRLCQPLRRNPRWPRSVGLPPRETQAPPGADSAARTNATRARINFLLPAFADRAPSLLRDRVDHDDQESVADVGSHDLQRVTNPDWRRGRDSNPRYGFHRTHAFQACDLNHSSTSPRISILYQTGIHDSRSAKARCVWYRDSIPAMPA